MGGGTLDPAVVDIGGRGATVWAQGGRDGVEGRGRKGFGHWQSGEISAPRACRRGPSFSRRKGKTVLRQAQHERRKGYSSIWKVRPACSVSRSTSAWHSSAPGVHIPPSPSLCNNAMPVSARIFDVQP